MLSRLELEPEGVLEMILIRQFFSKLRVLSLVSSLFLVACGESGIDLQKEFGVRGQDACDELNQAVSIVLSQHLTKGPADLDSLYRNTFRDMMVGWREALGQTGVSIRFDSRLNPIFQSKDLVASRRIRDCSDFVFLRRSIDQAYKEEYGLGLDEIPSWDERVVFQYFLEIFASRLDPFSRYEADYDFDYRRTYEYGALLDLIPLRVYGRSPETLKVLSAHADSSLKRGDEILEVSFGQRISGYSPQRWWTIQEVLEEDELGLAAVETLLSDSAYPNLKLRIGRDGELLEVSAQTLPLEKRAPRVFVERDSNKIYIRVLAFDPGIGQGDQPQIFSEAKSRVPTMIEDLLSELRAALKSYGKEWRIVHGNAEAIPLPHYVLDFRDNPGGAFSEAMALLHLFLKEDEGLGFIRSRNSSEEVTTYISELTRKEFKASWALDFFEDEELAREGFFESIENFPLTKKDFYLKSASTALMINEHSASASELVSMALLQTGRVAGFGQRSFGKAVGQASIRFLGQADEAEPLYHLGGELWFTTFELLGPRKEKSSGQGILPHFFVEDPVRKLWREDCQKRKSARTCRLYRAEDLGPSEVFGATKALSPASLQASYGWDLSALPPLPEDLVADFQRQVVYDFLKALFPVH